MADTTPLTPTADAIIDWLAREPRDDKGGTASWEDGYGVDIRTRHGSWRCITSIAGPRGLPWRDGDQVCFWTIRGEGKSSEGQTTLIEAERVAEARGYFLPGQPVS